MADTLGFYFEQHWLQGSNRPSLGDYSWWLVVVRRLCAHATDFEIRCWPGEEEAIETGRRFGTQVENTETKELVFKGKMTEDFCRTLCTQYLASGSLRWFTLILYKNGTPLLSSEHYGAEMYLLNLEEEELPRIQSLAKRYPAIAQVNVY